MRVQVQGPDLTGAVIDVN